VKHEVKCGADSAGKLKSENVIERFGNVKDEWAIIGTADETDTKACGGGRSTARWLES